MANGQWGLPKTDPNAAGGTSPLNLQQIFAAQWVNSGSNPVIKGGKVTGRSDLTYAYSAGVGLVKTANGVVYRTWDAGVTKLLNQPTVTRTDVIFVDRTGQIDVKVESSFDESQVCVLAKMIIPAGATSTSPATLKYDVNYAMPYGAAHGWVAAYGEYRSGAVPQSESMFQGSFNFSTDRKVDFLVRQAIYGDHQGHPATDARSLGMGWCRYELVVDSSLVQTFELPYTRGYTSAAWDFLAHTVPAGPHTFQVKRKSWTGQPARFFGSMAGEKLSGGFVGVRDAGVSQ